MKPKSPISTQLNRRVFNSSLAAAALLPSAWQTAAVEHRPNWQPKYMLASCLYGCERLELILPQVAHCGASALDLWPQPHGNQREQLDEIGKETFQRLLADHHVSLGCITQFPLGPFGLQEELKLAERLGCQTMVTGSSGPKGLSGNELKSAIAEFVDKLRPHLDAAQRHGVTIAIENHSNSLIDSPDSLRWLVESCNHPNLGIALAPYHLEQDADLLADLIRVLGDRIALFYAWQHGMGCMQAQPKEQELMQLPGRGELDFRPILRALQDMDYSGWVEIFMHPFPRGIPIMETVDEVTAEIYRARQYLAEQIDTIDS